MYKTEYTIKDCDVSKSGILKLSSLLRISQHVSNEANGELMLSREDLEPMGLLWVIAATGISISRLPKDGETVTVETSVYPQLHYFFPRNVKFMDAGGGVLADIDTLWSIIDKKSRTMVINPGNFCIEIKGEIEGRKYSLPKEDRNIICDRFFTFTPKGEYIDENAHLSNFRYADICLDEIKDELSEDEIKKVSFIYKKEILPGEKITAGIKAGGNKYYFIFGEDGRRFSAVFER